MKAICSILLKPPCNTGMGTTETPYNTGMGTTETPYNTVIGTTETPYNTGMGTTETPYNTVIGTTETPIQHCYRDHWNPHTGDNTSMGTNHSIPLRPIGDSSKGTLFFFKVIMVDFIHLVQLAGTGHRIKQLTSLFALLNLTLVASWSNPSGRSTKRFHRSYFKKKWPGNKSVDISSRYRTGWE